MPKCPREPRTRRRLVRRYIVEYQCEWCGQWFEPVYHVQVGQRYCKPSHRTNATIERRRLGIPPNRRRAVRWLEGHRVDLPADLVEEIDPIGWTPAMQEEENLRVYEESLAAPSEPTATPCEHQEEGQALKPDEARAEGG